MTMLKPASGRRVCKQRWPLQSLPSSLTLPLGLQLEQYALSQTSKDLCCQNADHVWSIRCPEDCQCKPRPSQPAQINNCNLKKTEDQCRKTGQHFVAPVCLPLCDLATVAFFFQDFQLTCSDLQRGTLFCCGNSQPHVSPLRVSGFTMSPFRLREFAGIAHLVSEFRGFWGLDFTIFQ